jgi:hypothetical protein
MPGTHVLTDNARLGVEEVDARHEHAELIENPLLRHRHAEPGIDPEDADLALGRALRATVENSAACRARLTPRHPDRSDA